VTIPGSVQSIGGWAFNGCSALESAMISEGVVSIGYASFYQCSALETVTIPESVTQIGVDAFQGCKRLNEILVNPLNLTYSSNGGILFNKDMTILIAYPTASGCFTIPLGVTIIEQYAFASNDDLKEIIIPDSVISIYSRAFEGCHALKNIYFDGDAPDTHYGAFSDIAPGVIAYVYPNAKGFPEEGLLWNGLIIALREGSSILYGDIFSDGVIDSRDVVKLAQYLAGWPSAVLSEQERKAADTFVDGVIDSKDIVKLAQYLAGWPVNLGK